MNIFDINVIHKRFGRGTVIKCDNKYVYVQFSDKLSKFEYPNAFENFIEAEDPVLQEKILNYLSATKKSEQEKKQAKLAEGGNRDNDANFISEILQSKITDLRLDTYQYIMQQVRNTNVATDRYFQRTFNGFYRIWNGKKWQKIYYEHFENIKNSNPSFSSIITHLYENLGRIEPSFSSKMLATIFPDKPIYDKFVCDNLNFKLRGNTKIERLRNAIVLYGEIENWYTEFLKTQTAKAWIQEIDRILPNYKWMSDVKKIDNILWAIGSLNNSQFKKIVDNYTR